MSGQPWPWFALISFYIVADAVVLSFAVILLLNMIHYQRIYHRAKSIVSTAVLFTITNTIYHVLLAVADWQFLLWLMSGTEWPDEGPYRSIYPYAVIAFLIQHYVLLIAIAARLFHFFQHGPHSMSCCARARCIAVLVLIPVLCILVGVNAALGGPLIINQLLSFLVLLIIIVTLIILITTFLVKLVNIRDRSNVNITNIERLNEERMLKSFLRRQTAIAVLIVGTTVMTLVFIFVRIRFGAPWESRTRGAALRMMVSVTATVNLISIAITYREWVRCPCRRWMCFRRNVPSVSAVPAVPAVPAVNTVSTVSTGNDGNGDITQFTVYGQNEENNNRRAGGESVIGTTSNTIEVQLAEIIAADSRRTRSISNGEDANNEEVSAASSAGQISIQIAADEEIAEKSRASSGGSATEEVQSVASCSR